MTREQVILEIKRFFDIDELVCDHTFAQYGQKAWQFLSTDYLHCLLIIRRDILKTPMYCNGRNTHQRGLRCNLCDMVKQKKVLYLSAHLMGQAGDFVFSAPTMTAEKARQLIVQNAHLLPCKIRLEDGVSWLHMDTRPSYDQIEKVKLFKA